jgi:hypothetical protein
MASKIKIPNSLDFFGSSLGRGIMYILNFPGINLVTNYIVLLLLSFSFTVYKLYSNLCITWSSQGSCKFFPWEKEIEVEEEEKNKNTPLWGKITITVLSALSFIIFLYTSYSYAKYYKSQQHRGKYFITTEEQKDLKFLFKINMFILFSYATISYIISKKYFTEKKRKRFLQNVIEGISFSAFVSVILALRTADAKLAGSCFEAPRNDYDIEEYIKSVVKEEYYKKGRLNFEEVNNIEVKQIENIKKLSKVCNISSITQQRDRGFAMEMDEYENRINTVVDFPAEKFIPPTPVKKSKKTAKVSPAEFVNNEEEFNNFWREYKKSSVRTTDINKRGVSIHNFLVGANPMNNRDERPITTAYTLDTRVSNNTTESKFSDSLKVSDFDKTADELLNRRRFSTVESLRPSGDNFDFDIIRE